MKEEETTYDYLRNVSNPACNGLTPIPQSIHCPATQTSSGSSNHELDDIAIEHFLDTLAEVALSISARELSERQDDDRDT